MDRVKALRLQGNCQPSMTAVLTDNFAFPAQLALFLDFDGTLVGFKNDPDTVHLTQEQTQVLLQLNESLSGALAVISGRDLRDLVKRIPDMFWRIGNHGLYSLAPGDMPADEFGAFPFELLTVLAQNLTRYEGVWIEEKGPMIAIHHRAIPRAGLDIVKLAKSRVAAHQAPASDLIVQRGHNVVEIKPANANKGKSINALMAQLPFSGRTPVMIGDDNTDEDGFLAVQNMGGFGIKLGPGPTQAKFRVLDSSTLYALLGNLL